MNSDPNATTPLTIEDDLRADLRQFIADIIPNVMRPSDLYAQGQWELIDKYGKAQDVPISELSENEKMTEAYNSVPQVIAESLLKLREILINHLGPTGAQVAFADGEVLAKSIGFDGPMRIVKADTFLYPQYDGIITDWANSPDVKSWVAERAQERLLASPVDLLAEPVRERLEALAVAPDTVKLEP